MYNVHSQCLLHHRHSKTVTITIILLLFWHSHVLPHNSRHYLGEFLSQELFLRTVQVWTGLVLITIHLRQVCVTSPLCQEEYRVCKSAELGSEAIGLGSPCSLTHHCAAAVSQPPQQWPVGSLMTLLMASLIFPGFPGVSPLSAGQVRG